MEDVVVEVVDPRVEEAVTVVEVTIEEAMIVVTLLEVGTVEDTEADREDTHHIDSIKFGSASCTDNIERSHYLGKVFWYSG